MPHKTITTEIPEERIYKYIFELCGVNDTSIIACYNLAINKIDLWIDAVCDQNISRSELQQILDDFTNAPISFLQRGVNVEWDIPLELISPIPDNVDRMETQMVLEKWRKEAGMGLIDSSGRFV